jgi:ParB-like chromosome segregation protein Spo0J
MVPLDSLKPAPENNIYSTIAWDNPELRQLASSIRQHGLLEPIRVSRDGFIISGHRRRMASFLAGLKEVPVQIDSLSRAENPEEFVKKLIRNVVGSGASCSARWTIFLDMPPNASTKGVAAATNDFV